MARLPLIDPSEPGPSAALLAEIAGERGKPFNVYRMLAHSPGALERMYSLSSYLWSESSLDSTLVELVILRVAQLTGSDYEWSRHLAIARRIGVASTKIELLTSWPEKRTGLSQEEQRALQLTDEVTLAVEASRETVAAVSESFGEQATVELVLLIGLYGAVSRLLRSLDVDPEPGDEPVPDIRRAFRHVWRGAAS
jgi:4-carboxymuconolactone decarboxylase